LADCYNGAKGAFAMVAVARYIPDDPKQKESVLAVLRERPELQDFIARVSEEAESRFPDVHIALDTVQYDEWDPPVRMLIHVTQPWTEYLDAVDQFTHVIGIRPDHNRNLIFVMPMWAGPIESYIR
jgi:hypothetical protein